MGGAQVLSVNVGRGRPVPAEVSSPGRTAIDKRPVPGRVAAGPLGLAGDEQCDKPSHGGVDQAVYAYSSEDYAVWSGVLGRQLRPGQYGENLTTAGIDLTAAVIGERWQVGGTVLEVSFPRIPCRTFAHWMDEPQWVVRFTEKGLPGAYLRVIEPGDLGAGDAINVLSRPGHGATILDAFRCFTGDHSLAPLVLAAPLPEKFAARARGWPAVAD